MKRNSVIIKSNTYGLILILDPDLSFEELLSDVGQKFRDAAKFFKNAKMALTFRGRVLTREQERRLICAITENSSLNILCLVDEQPEAEEYYKEAIVRSTQADEQSDGQFYRGTLRSGQVLEAEKSVVILGDVNPGAQVISRGNIVVLGCCMGNVYAGASGNRDCFAAGLIMKPNQVRIADKTARSAITKKNDTGEYAIDPKIITIREGHLKLEPLNGKFFADMLEEKAEELSEGVSEKPHTDETAGSSDKS